MPWLVMRHTEAKQREDQLREYQQKMQQEFQSREQRLLDQHESQRQQRDLELQRIQQDVRRELCAIDPLEREREIERENTYSSTKTGVKWVLVCTVQRSPSPPTRSWSRRYDRCWVLQEFSVPTRHGTIYPMIQKDANLRFVMKRP